MLVVLNGYQVYAQRQPGRPGFIVPTMNGNDTVNTIEEAGKKWFDINRLPGSTPDQSYKYQSSKLNDDGSSLLVTFQIATKNRAGIGGALKPKIERTYNTDPTNVIVEYIGGYATINTGTGTAHESSSNSKAKYAVYENHVEGSYTHIDTRNKVVPTLKYDNLANGGASFVKFDGNDSPMNFIDRKLNVTGYPKSIMQVSRAAEALRQNPQATLRYEVPKNKVNAMKKLLKKAGQDQNPRITVVGVDFQPYIEK